MIIPLRAAALSVALGACAQPSVPPPSSGSGAAMTEAERREVEQAILSVPVVAAIAEHFPEDYDDLVARLEAARAAGEAAADAPAAQAAVEEASRAFMKEFFEPRYGLIDFAPDAEVTAMIAEARSVVSEFQSVAGPEICGKAISGDKDYRAWFLDTVEERGQDYVAKIVEAMAAARTRPAKRRAPTPDDRAALSAALSRRGAPQGALVDAGSEAAPPGEFCATLIASLAGLEDVEGEAGVRLRGWAASRLVKRGGWRTVIGLPPAA